MTPYYDEAGITIHHGDAREVLTVMAEGSVQCCVTSPPYWGLRDYDVDGQLGLEKTPELYVEHLVAVFREVRRVLRDDGTLWLNLGDSYASTSASGTQGQPGQRADRTFTAERMPAKTGAVLKSKNLVGIPWRVAFALQADGWYLRSDIIWHKPNPMPESVTDRPTKSHEYLFLMSKNATYYYNADAIRESGVEPNRQRNDRVGGTHEAAIRHSPGGIMRASETRNKRSVWTVPTHPYPKAHFATFPPRLIEPCIKAGTQAGDTVLDPFMGSGTTAMVARELECPCIGVELNSAYIDLAVKRLGQVVFDWSEGHLDFVGRKRHSDLVRLAERIRRA